METIQVRRANMVLTIKKSEAERYLAKGFNILDEHGHVIKNAMPTAVGELQVAYANHVKQIDELTAEIKTLREEYAKLSSEYEEFKAKAAKPKKTVKKPAEEPKE